MWQTARVPADQEPPESGGLDGDKPGPVEQPGDGKGGPVDDESSRYPSGGSMEFQDAATTTPRPATPAELRAREKFAKRQQEAEEAVAPPTTAAPRPLLLIDLTQQTIPRSR